MILADSDQNMLLCNYNKNIHQEVFMGLHDFMRISNLSSNFNLSISNCFNEAPINFTIDQQTMLNLRIAIEVLDTYQVRLSPDGVEAVKNIKSSFNKDKHPSLVRLEKQLSKENIIDLLKFFNSDNNLLMEEMSSNLIEQVDSIHQANSHQLLWTTRDN